MGEVFANQPPAVISTGGTTAPASGTVETRTASSPSGFPAADPAACFRVTGPALQGPVLQIT